MAVAASIEIPPARVLEMQDLAAVLPKGVRVYLPELGTDNNETFVAAACALRAIGAEPVPHLAARRIASHAALEARVARLASEAGVTDVLVLAGSPPSPEGPFADSMKILETGVLDRHGITHIGVAGHPEGSPHFTDEVVQNAMRWKADFAMRSDAEMRIVTQFGFDVAGMVRWSEEIAASGITLPVHLGFAGPTKLRAMLRYARSCGVGPSMQVLTSRGNALLRLFAGYAPEPLVRELETALARMKTGNIAQIHLYPFGGSERTANWLRARGSWPEISA
ncbi:5,10-methylenetetrahydrofolate reductase [Thalassovita gelatinovora]|uniref:Methylenetetrahydrofolate reductase n=1 Tax=Thalassovita gelatinovora TaxID=53501 RepID=A0A0N7LUJ3_THAGE|nr:methylenetetrahydrofolate reductase [Thalassovita gelatinovora]CUH63658.1 5,10-methylenetetrahydrofolate reductase [Thalassovita gelatinovora]SER01070.1 methylenetetrahydrofolate reductase (NADPH) [Thalassovita gelatinovora]